ncbi:MAG: alpha/beta fold hydrolase [Rubrivivax sp.]
MPTTMLLPGLACDAALWTQQQAALSTLGPVIVADAHTRFDSLPRMAAALLAENPGALRLIGSSMGGMLALEMVRQAPHRIAAMALLGSSARPDTAELLKLRAEAIVLFEQGRMMEVLRANVAFAFDPENARRPALVRSYLDMVVRAGAQQLIAQNRAVMARPDSRSLLPSIGCPVLVACGESDLLTPPECSREMAKAIPGARLEMIARCGHMLTLEQPARVNALLLDWLGSIDSIG